LQGRVLSPIKYLVYIFTNGNSTNQGKDIMSCANCSDEWNEVFSAESHEAIRTKVEHDNFDWASLLHELNEQDLQTFKADVHFFRIEIYDEYDEKMSTKKGVSEFNTSLLVDKYNYTPEQVETVAKIFGIKPDMLPDISNFKYNRGRGRRCIPCPGRNCSMPI